MSFAVLKSQIAILSFFANAAVKCAVAGLHHSGQLLVIDNALGGKQTTREGVHGADVGDEAVFDVGRLTTDFAVEVEATRAETTHLPVRLDTHILLNSAHKLI